MIDSDLQYCLKNLDISDIDQKHVLFYVMFQRGYEKTAIAQAVNMTQWGSVIHGIDKINVQYKIYPEIKEYIKRSCMKIAGIATITDRKDELKCTIESLYSQVDRIHVYTNGYVPEYSEDPEHKVRYFTGEDLGDWGKFYEIPENVWYFSCDDDLIYPVGYVDYMISKSNEYNCPVSLHGRILNPPIMSYYKSGVKFKCLESVDQDIHVNCIGTGTMCFFSTDTPIPHFVNGYMADIWFSTLAQEEQVPLVVVKHEKGYICYQQVKNTLYEQYCNNDDYQTRVVNKYIKTIHQDIVNS